MMESRGLTANGVCPLCESQAWVRTSAATLQDDVVCNRCGRYHIEEGALNGLEHQRHLLSGMTRLGPSNGPEAIVTITAANAEELVTTALGLSGGFLNQLDATLE